MEKNETKKPTQKAAAFNKEDYLEELLVIGSMKLHDNSRFSRRFKLWRQAAKKQHKRLPFECLMQKYALKDAEWFCVCFIAYRNLLDKRYESSRSNLIEALLSTGLARPGELKDIFGPEGTLFARQIIEDRDGKLVLADRYFEELMGFSLARMKGSSARAVEPEYIFPLDLAQRIKRRVIGQDEAVDKLVCAVYEHYLKIQSGKEMYKNNVLLLGPTGTGKTFLCRVLAEELGVAFFAADAAPMTATGYVGFSAGEIFAGLRRKVDKMEENTFPFSIVYIDEVDKLCASLAENDITGRKVQEEFLKILESREYTCCETRFSADRKYNISNVLFIAGGAFSGLENIIAQRVRSGIIGFNAKEKEAAGRVDFSQVTFQDLEKYGLMPEFLGRFGVRAALRPLAEQDFLDILTRGEESVLNQYKMLFRKEGIRLEIRKNALKSFCRQALAQQTGARGLAQVLSGILGPALLKCKRERKKKFVLQAEESV